MSAQSPTSTSDAPPGEHSSPGAVDVVPVGPAADVTMKRRVWRWLAEIGVRDCHAQLHPDSFYEEASTNAARTNLEDIRRARI